MDRLIGGRILGGQPILLGICGQGSRVPFIPGCKISRSLFGIIEPKKSAEWWNMKSDENHGWTDSPEHQESYTQQDYEFVHIPSMRKTPVRLIAFRVGSH